MKDFPQFSCISAVFSVERNAEKGDARTLETAAVASRENGVFDIKRFFSSPRMADR
jgi:hypothetical protein